MEKDFHSLKAPHKFSIPEKTIPIALLILIFTVFGLLIPWLGLYWDDWPVVFISKFDSLAAYWKFYQYDRPFSAWTYVLLIPLLGVKPIVWQIFTLLLRWLATWLMWSGLNRLWPRHVETITWAAFLFAIYPTFDQQAISIAYSQHWICCLLFFLSIWAMIRAQQTGKWYFTLLALSAAALELWTMEYFVGLDLIRPFFLFILVSRDVPSQRQRIVLTSKKWLPYFLLLMVYVVWRIFILKIPGGDPNSPDMLRSLVQSPLTALAHLFQVALQDVTYIVAGIWSKTLLPEGLILNEPLLQVFFVLIIVIGAVSFFYLQHLVTDDPGEPSNSWARQVVLVGIVGVFLGTLPAWIIDRQVTAGLYGSRFSFAAMFGASLLLAGLLEWFTPRRLSKLVLIAILLGLAANSNLRTTRTFRAIAEKQRNFYWQLYWRAPSIKSGTALISDGEIFSYMGLYPTSMAINLLYPKQDSGKVPLWFFSILKVPASSETLRKGFVLKDGIRNYTFEGKSADILAINYQPEDFRCLWVLSSSDADNKNLPHSISTVIQLSNLDRITSSVVAGWKPPADVFGDEPAHQWCYFYQKAQLARQNKDWTEINRLGAEAEQKGFTPFDSQEFFPFLEGYAYTGQSSKAYQLTMRIRKINPHIDDRLCNLWRNIVLNRPDSVNLKQTFADLNERLGCSDR